MSKIYKTTIVEELPQSGEPDILYLVEENGNFAAYVFVGTEFLRVGEEYELATTSSDGLMSAEDKAKLDNIGDMTNQGAESSYTVPDNTKSLVGVIRLPAGKWLVITMVYFAGNSGGGWRYSFVSTSSVPSSASRIDRTWEDNGANVGNTTYNSRITNIVDVDSGIAQLYLYAQQNSGATITCRSQWKAIRIV